jgi:uncharacterized protein (UPF0261 family)
MMKHDPMVKKEMPSCFIIISTSSWDIVNWQIFQYVPSSVLTARLNEFEAFLKSQKIPYVKKITYLRLVDFVADYKAGLLGSA